MSGIFGTAMRENCSEVLFLGIGYHSHLGSAWGGEAVYGARGFRRAVHSLKDEPYGVRSGHDLDKMEGSMGIGCISDSEPQPILIQSRLGTFALCTVGRINNRAELADELWPGRTERVKEAESRSVTELAAALISRGNSIPEGIRLAQEKIDGSLTLILMTRDGIFAARDLRGRTPLCVGSGDRGNCVSFENFAYRNQGFQDDRQLGPGEIVYITPDSVTRVMDPAQETRICSFLWTYYGYPNSIYEGINVEEARYRSGAMLAAREDVKDLDFAAGVPYTGTAHGIGFSNGIHIPFKRPLLKYTDNTGRAFLKSDPDERKKIEKSQLTLIEPVIRGKKMAVIDDSLVRGIQLRRNVAALRGVGAEEVHVRISCPPMLHTCPFLNFTHFNSEDDLIARRAAAEVCGHAPDEKELEQCADPNSPCYGEMVRAICEEQGFDSLKFQKLEDLIQSIGLPAEKLCTYCFDGKREK